MGLARMSTIWTPTVTTVIVYIDRRPNKKSMEDSMPKIVDHDERRREVLSAARRVIVRDGIDAATTRAIAKEAGYSNGVLAHYFTDKDEILLSALRQSHQRIRDRLTRKVEGVPGLA